MPRNTNIDSVKDKKSLFEGEPPEKPIRRQDEPIASTREDTTSPRETKTGLQYKFQRSSATVTYSRS